MQQAETSLAAAPAPVNPFSEKDTARFWSKVNKDGPLPDQSNPHYAGLDPCWEWTGRKRVANYGGLCLKGKEVLAHRISFAIHFGETSLSRFVLHRCDNPACVNPSHLFAGSNQDNITDMMSKGRGNKATGARSGRVKYPERWIGRFNPQRGEKHPHCRLTDTQVDEIRALVAAGESTRQVAIRFNTGHSYVSQIVRFLCRKTKTTP